jgi:hypothetical protein
MATGRDVLAVARESYALTLYTHWHFEQRRRLDQIARKSERFDMAGLMAAAYHEPSKLQDRYDEFAASLRAPTGVAIEPSAVALARQIAVVRAAHSPRDVQTLIPS